MEKTDRESAGQEFHYPKKSYRGFLIWFAIFTAVLSCASLNPASVTLFGRAEDIGLLICLLFDLLFLLIYWTERIYWINGVTYEEAARAGKQARQRYAWRHLRIFLGATGIYLLYCILGDSWFGSGTEVRHAMTAAGVLCVAAALATIPVKLEPGDR